MNAKDKKKKRKRLTSPGAHVRKGKRAVTSRKKSSEEEAENREEFGPFGPQDYLDALGFDPWEDDESDDEKR